MNIRKSICIPAAPPVDVSDFIPIIDSHQFQRLRGIKQLGINDLIFPGAQHSRFEHAIGVLGLTQRLCQLQDISGHDAALLQSFALLHDIGHGPYSHQLEPVLQGNHHLNGIEIIKSMHDAIDRCGIDSAEIIEMLSGNNPLAIWVTDRNLGTDKLDYLHRDALHIGFQGLPDIERIQFYTKNANGVLMLDERLLEDGKQLQKFYSYLHQHGYLNKTALTAQRMLQRAVQEELLLAKQDGSQLWKANDWELMAWLKSASSPLTKRLSSNLEQRILHKNYLTLKPSGYGFVEKTAGKDLKVIELSRKDLSRLANIMANTAKLREIEDKIAENINLRAGDILISAMPYFTKLIPKDMIIFTGENEPPFSLFDKDKDHVTSLESDYLRTFAIRFAVVEKYRRKLMLKAEDIISNLLDGE